MVSYRHIANIHRDAVNRVMFDPGADVIMTSSESETSSVVFTKVSVKQETYIWKFSQVIYIIAELNSGHLEFILNKLKGVLGHGDPERTV